MNSLRSGYDAGSELNSGRLCGQRRIAVVDRPNLDDRRTAALVEADRRVDEVGAAERELANDVRRNVRVACFGEIAVGRAGG